MKKALQGRVSKEQMAYWMQDLTEITVLDYIFSQQDRIGNIDFVPYWQCSEGGKVRQVEAEGEHVPAALAAHKPLLIKRTRLNDNDTGGKRRYATFTKTTGMLEKIRHYNPETYRRLIRLDKDFGAKGELYAYLRDTFELTDVQLQQAVTNTHKAADILCGTCRAGKRRFDLDPDAFLVTGKAEPHKVDCDNP